MVRNPWGYGKGHLLVLDGREAAERAGSCWEAFMELFNPSFGWGLQDFCHVTAVVLDLELAALDAFTALNNHILVSALLVVSLGGSLGDGRSKDSGSNNGSDGGEFHGGGVWRGMIELACLNDGEEVKGRGVLYWLQQEMFVISYARFSSISWRDKPLCALYTWDHGCQGCESYGSQTPQRPEQRWDNMSTASGHANAQRCVRRDVKTTAPWSTASEHATAQRCVRHDVKNYGAVINCKWACYSPKMRASRREKLWRRDPSKNHKISAPKRCNLKYYGALFRVRTFPRTHLFRRREKNKK